LTRVDGLAWWRFLQFRPAAQAAPA
jgi:hypothetical protein